MPRKCKRAVVKSSDKTKITADEARLVWESLDDPTYNAVIKIFKQSGRNLPVCTIKKWQENNWKGATYDPMAILDIAIPAVTGDVNIRTQALQDLFDRAVGGEPINGSEFEKLLLPIAKEIAAYKDNELLIQSHRDLLRMATLGSRMTQIHPENFVTNPEKMGTLALALARCVETVTGSLQTNHMLNIMKEQKQVEIKDLNPEPPKIAKPEEEDPLDDIFGVKKMLAM